MTTDRQVSLTIDGQEVTCPHGTTVFEAADSAGIHIPTFCHHEKLVPVGACRMCLVEIEGARGLQTSCTTPVREGMAVKVHTSPAAVQAREANLEFLLTNHPLDCPVCDKGGECPLQDQALLDGPGQSRYIEEKRHKYKRHPLGELIVLDQERCVLCWRCIRYLDEWADDHELDLFGRGASTRLDTFPGRPLTSKWQGNTIDICPVGALTSRAFRFEARVWELANTPSVCPLCSVGCNITLGVKNNQLRRITPRENPEVNDAWICDRGRFGHGYVDHPDRLTQPLIRREGELEHATWDEALDLVAVRFSQIVGSQGPDAVAGIGSVRATNEANYLFQRFMRSVIGTNNVDHMERIPHQATPLTSLSDIEHRDVILLLNCDPSTEAPLVELWIKKAVLRHGAQVITVNPRQIELDRYASAWLGCRPGSEAALLNGLARAILENPVEGNALSSQTTRATNPDEFREWLAAYTPRQVEQLAGTPPTALREAASILAQAQNPIILYGSGWRHGTSGVARRLDAIANLSLLLGSVETGFLTEENNTLGATEMGVVPDLYPARQPFDDNRVRSRLASFWGGRLSPVHGIDCDQMITAAAEGNLEAMWIMGSDPAGNCQRASASLGGIPFLVVQDLFMTETASLAEVVLPAASYAEVDGSFFNLTGRLQAIQAAMRPPGQARPNWQVIAELARRLVDGKRQRSWDFSGPADILAEIGRALPGYRGLDYAKMGGHGWQRPASGSAPRRSFVLVEPDLPPHSAHYPLALVTGRLLYDQGTRMRRSERLQALVPEAHVMIHPSDAAKLGLASGDTTAVVSASGRLGLTVKVSDEVMPGVAFAPLNLSAAPLSVLIAERWSIPHVRLEK
jgi:NADH-quinone oxidoreductase chain G